MLELIDMENPLSRPLSHDKCSQCRETKHVSPSKQARNQQRTDAYREKINKSVIDTVEMYYELKFKYCMFDLQLSDPNISSIYDSVVNKVTKHTVMIETVSKTSLTQSASTSFIGTSKPVIVETEHVNIGGTHPKCQDPGCFKEIETFPPVYNGLCSKCNTYVSVCQCVDKISVEQLDAPEPVEQETPEATTIQTAADVDETHPTAGFPKIHKAQISLPTLKRLRCKQKKPIIVSYDNIKWELDLVKSELQSIDRFHYSVLFLNDEVHHAAIDNYLVVLRELPCYARMKVFLNSPYLAFIYYQHYGQYQCCCPNIVNYSEDGTRIRYCVESSNYFLGTMTVEEYLLYLHIRKKTIGDNRKITRFIAYG